MAVPSNITVGCVQLLVFIAARATNWETGQGIGAYASELSTPT